MPWASGPVASPECGLCSPLLTWSAVMFRGVWGRRHMWVVCMRFSSSVWLWGLGEWRVVVAGWGVGVGVQLISCYPLPSYLVDYSQWFSSSLSMSPWCYSAAVWPPSPPCRCHRPPWPCFLAIFSSSLSFALTPKALFFSWGRPWRPWWAPDELTIWLS